jgi:hypothetical protein
MEKFIELFALPLGIALFIIICGILYLLAKGLIDVEAFGAKITGKGPK